MAFRTCCDCGHGYDPREVILFALVALVEELTGDEKQQWLALEFQF